MDSIETGGATDDPRPRMLFLRRYGGFTGGHQKYIDYIGHVLAHGRFRPLLHVTADSLTDELDALLPAGIERVDLPHPCEAVFVAGVEWSILDAAGQDCTDVPVINLIQGIRHADPAEPQYQYLSRPALRICVSQEVADAISATGRVNGPVHVIENGIDLDAVATFRHPHRNGRIVVAARKDPRLGRDVSRALAERNIDHELLTDKLPQADYFRRLARFDHAILLPKPTEGFYLPALEAMVLGVTVVMPDCGGARTFAIDGQTCRIAPRDPDALADAAAQLLAEPQLVEKLRAGGQAISTRHSLADERRKAFAIFDRIAT